MAMARFSLKSPGTAIFVIKDLNAQCNESPPSNLGHRPSFY